MWWKALWMTVALLSLSASQGGVWPRANAPIPLSQVVRLRVIGNSDSPVDQAVKLDVRDTVLDLLKPSLAHVQTEHQLLRALRRDRVRVADRTNQVLDHLGVHYESRVSLTRTLFPTKIYGSWVLPSGTYTAFLVKLGHAQGHNWWCVLYPSLCFMPGARANASMAPGHAARLQVEWRLPPLVRVLDRFLAGV